MKRQQIQGVMVLLYRTIRTVIKNKQDNKCMCVSVWLYPATDIGYSYFWKIIILRWLRLKRYMVVEVGK